MPSTEIRAATGADVYAMSDLMERQVRRYLLRDCTPAGQKALLASVAPERLGANLRENYAYHVAANGADVYGVIGLRNHNHVHHLFVADAVRGSGLGRRLWETARDEVCIHATAPPLFTVNSAPGAVGFYKALGFQPSGDEEERDGVRSQPMRYVLLGMGAKL